MLKRVKECLQCQTVQMMKGMIILTIYEQQSNNLWLITKVTALDPPVKALRRWRFHVIPTGLRRQCTRMDNTFPVIVTCQDMEGGDAGRGGMTNSGLLKALGLNTIVVAERGHYWKWVCHHGRLC